jgi:hypothetical protein
MKARITVATATLALGGCHSGSKAPAKAAPGMVNATCPFSNQPVGAGVPTADWGGETVGFCCAGCVTRWDGWTDEQKRDYVSAQQ